MSRCVDESLPELVLGGLDTQSAAEIRAHVASCRRCATELAALEGLLGELPLELSTTEPPQTLRTRVLASAAALQGAKAPDRFATLVSRVGALLDVAREQAAQLVAIIDEATSWKLGPAADTALIHLPGGPRVAALNCGFVRVAAGAAFPLHRHLGDEHVLVLQGGYIDSSGRVVRVGEEAFLPAGSEHAFVALPPPESDLIYLVILGEGITFADGRDPGI